MTRIKRQFQGMSPHRYQDNPLEKAFAAAWQEANDQTRPGMVHSTLAYLMDENNRGRPNPPLTQRDWLVANTVIQWLGSPIGQGFLKDVLKRQTDSARLFRQDLMVDAGDI